MEFWSQFPSEDELLKQAAASGFQSSIYNVNAHLHTPYSFSAFYSVDHALQMAVKEDVKICGINDFFTTAGYEEWAKACTSFKVFPLFNIEFIGLSREDQENDVRINDPSNPGRIYISGKGLSFPSSLNDEHKRKLVQVQDASNNHSAKICEKLNEYLHSIAADIRLNYDDILNNNTKGLLRERHLAKILREQVFKYTIDETGRKVLLSRILGGDVGNLNIENHSLIEEAIRGKLLKYGGPAYIQENPDTFLDMEMVKEIIIKGGGIPTYPLLADSVNGGFTEFEENKQKLVENLKSKGIYSVEFIPNRNSTAALEEYATYFVENGFVVTFGSEHNTPALIPVKLITNSGDDLSDTLKKINHEGACIVAAHQYLFGRTGKGILNEYGVLVADMRDRLIRLGNALIQNFIKQ